MAEIIENGKHEMHKDIPSMGKANAALTTGIIGTSLAGLLALGALGKGSGLLNLGGSNGCGCQANNNCGCK